MCIKIILHFGKLRSGAAGDFGDPQVGQLRLELIELLRKLGFGFRPQLGALNFTLQQNKTNFHKETIRLSLMSEI